MVHLSFINHGLTELEGLGDHLVQGGDRRPQPSYACHGGRAARGPGGLYRAHVASTLWGETGVMRPPHTPGIVTLPPSTKLRQS